jgi:hypothetical protein
MSVAEYLSFWGQTADTNTLDDTLPAESRSGENPVRSVLHPVHAVAILIKDDGMNVDLEPGTIRKNEVGLRTAGLSLKTPAFQSLA